MSTEIFNYREVEAAIDIALTTGEIIDRLSIDDSRELVRFIANQAKEFEAGLIHNFPEDAYMDEIEKFAQKVILEKYEGMAEGDIPPQAQTDFGLTYNQGKQVQEILHRHISCLRAGLGYAIEPDDGRELRKDISYISGLIKLFEKERAN